MLPTGHNLTFDQALMKTLSTYSFSGIRVYLLGNAAKMVELKRAFIELATNDWGAPNCT